MNNALIDGDLPPRWGLAGQRGTGGAGQRVLWFGLHRVALDDIQFIRAEETRERPVEGLLIAAFIFFVVAMIFAFGVFESGWRTRFLLGAAFVSFLGVAGMIEMSRIKAQRFFEIKIGTRAQGVLTFASADIAEVDAFLGALAGAGVKA